MDGWLASLTYSEELQITSSADDETVTTHSPSHDSPVSPLLPPVWSRDSVQTVLHRTGSDRRPVSAITLAASIASKHSRMASAIDDRPRQADLEAVSEEPHPGTRYDTWQTFLDDASSIESENERYDFAERLVRSDSVGDDIVASVAHEDEEESHFTRTPKSVKPASSRDVSPKTQVRTKFEVLHPKVHGSSAVTRSRLSAGKSDLQETARQQSWMGTDDATQPLAMHARNHEDIGDGLHPSPNYNPKPSNDGGRSGRSTSKAGCGIHCEISAGGHPPVTWTMPLGAWAVRYPYASRSGHAATASVDETSKVKRPTAQLRQARSYDLLTHPATADLTTRNEPAGPSLSAHTATQSAANDENIESSSISRSSSTASPLSTKRKSKDRSKPTSRRPTPPPQKPLPPVPAKSSSRSSSIKSKHIASCVRPAPVSLPPRPVSRRSSLACSFTSPNLHSILRDCIQDLSLRYPDVDVPAALRPVEKRYAELRRLESQAYELQLKAAQLTVMVFDILKKQY